MKEREKAKLESKKSRKKTSKLEVDPLGEEGKEEKIGRKEGRK